MYGARKKHNAVAAGRAVCGLAGAVVRPLLLLGLSPNIFPFFRDYANSARPRSVSLSVSTFVSLAVCLSVS